MHRQSIGDVYGAMHASLAAPPSLSLARRRRRCPPCCCRRSLALQASSAMNILLGVLALVGGYFILSLLREIFFPPKAQPLEYKPRQVGRGSGRRWSF